MREEILSFVDELSAQLVRLSDDLPQGEEPVSEESATRIAKWYADFKPLMATKAKKYISPDNVSDAALPVGIMLTTTTIGTLIGGPPGGALGLALGKFVSGDLKPGRAADEIFKHATEKTEPSKD